VGSEMCISVRSCCARSRWLKKKVTLRQAAD
jgi:hypothetical protein